MTQKWNLQDIRPNQSRKRRMPAEGATFTPQSAPVETSREDAPELMSIKITNGNKKKGRALLYAFIIFFIVVGGGIIASALTGGADITVYPKHREPVINATYQAYKDAQPGQLPYEIMTLDADGERQVKASGTEKVSTQAQGTLFVYNTQQSEPLKLIANTRFESADGHIFRIKDPVMVPGYTTDASGKKAPGVMTVTVYADQPGDEYNLAPGKFTVPGFKGKPEYLTVYAESTSAFSGGYIGDKFIIADADLQTAQQSLRTELRNTLLGRISAEKPAGFVAFDGAVSFTYESLPSVAYGDNLATIKEKVTMRIPIFKEDDLASFLAKASVPGYDDAPVRISDYGTLTFTYSSATTSASDISSLMNISFNLNGKPQIIWKYDADKLKSQLLNLNKTALTGVLGAYPAIEKANAVIRPFWKTKFPTKINDIKITEVVATSTP